MKSSKLQIIVFRLVAISAILVSSTAIADGWTKATKLTFREAVEVPGMVLPAGVYWFQLASSANRNTVQVWNEDRTELITTILSVPDYRRQPTEKTRINFEERPHDSPEAIHAWFYPGDNFGQEFVYPRSEMMHLAKPQNWRPVLSIRNQPAAAEPLPAAAEANFK